MKICVFSLVFSLSLIASAQGKVLATVGSKTITLEDFEKKFAEVRSQTLNPPTKEQFLEDLIRFEIGVQEAEKRKLENDPVVQDRFKQELYKALLEKELGVSVQKITVTDKEMADWYAQNPEIRTSHILIEVKPGATQAQREEAKKRAQQILDEVRASKRPFEELVRLYSDDPLSKQAGGDIGWQSRVTMVPQYYETANKLKLNEISPLVETQFGFHIIKLTGRRSFENANKRQIRAAVFDEKRKQAFHAYFDKLKKSYNIKVDKSLLK
ncbi:MAG: peptidylprolyl isomerase [Bdellovibrionaceae bacterium]|nr:peptidylprolyl isomerase [Pseudobdellovibrionaceae bacterium]